MSTFASAQAEVAPASNPTVTDLVVPVDLRQVQAFSDLRLTNETTVARKQRLRSIVEEGIDSEWNDITPLLSPTGDYAGGASFAHAIVADRIFRSEEEAFNAVGNVTLRELWPLIHEAFKKRGLVFQGGFVTGMRR